MKYITPLFLLINISILILLDIWMWSLNITYGVCGILGIIAFFIGYSLSTEIAIAPKDFWLNSSLTIFMKKISIANISAFMTWAIVWWITDKI